MSNATVVTSAPALFDFNGSCIRVVMVDDEPWFIASDVAKVLEYSSTKDMTRILDGDQKGGQNVPTPGGDQRMTIISESGLYSCVLKSRKKEAKVFRRWVTDEVLPSIRKTGSYGQPDLAPVVEKLIGMFESLTNRLEQVEARSNLLESRQNALPAPQNKQTAYAYCKFRRIPRGASRRLGARARKIAEYADRQGELELHEYRGQEVIAYPVDILDRAAAQLGYGNAQPGLPL